jgi:uncharacterized damage-inducible protein DinB
MSLDTEFITEFKSECLFRWSESLERIHKCIAELDQDSLWYSPNENTNSVANLILHLRGNISQYIIGGLGAREFKRQRDLEFSTQGGYSNQELSDLIAGTVQTSKGIVQGLNREQLERRYKIQGFDLSGISVIIHVTEHLSYHTGQIALLTKELRNKDLGFYDDMDLNQV